MVQIIRVREVVEAVDVDGENGRILHIAQPRFVSRRQLADVFGVHVPLIRPIPQGNAAHNHFMVSLQVDNQVWFGDFFTEGGVHTAVHRQLVILQIEPGKQLIFGKRVIGNEHALPQGVWHSFMLLMVAAQQEK